MLRLPHFMKRSLTVMLVGSVISFLCIAVLQRWGYLEFFELAAYDLMMRMTPKPIKGESRITLIEISEDDIRSFGRWPMTDAILGRAIADILEAKPRAVGLDIYRDIPVPPGSAELNRILSMNHQLVGVMKFGSNGVQPPAILKNTDQVGFNDIIVDPGGIVRRGLLFLDDGKQVYNSFAFQLAMRYLQAENITPQPDPINPQYLRIKQTTIKPLEANDGGYVRADARGYQFLLDFRDTESRSYSLDSLLSGEVPGEVLHDKVVIIGVSAQSVKDFFFTPMSRGTEESRQVPGVILHAHSVSQLLRFALEGTKPMATPIQSQKLTWLLFWSLVGGLIGYRARAAWLFLALMTGCLAVLFLVTLAAFASSWWIPFAPPALSLFLSAFAVTAYLSAREKKKRALLMQIFSRHVSKEVAEVIWKQRDQFMNEGRPRSQKMPVTVFFSDLRGFTSVSEKMDPQELIEWLNTYMEAMTRLIMDHGGVVDDYAGDGIKANFGVPVPRKSEAEVRTDVVNAIECALAMEREMAHLNREWQKTGLPSMGIRVGIFTGVVVAGLLGSPQRLKYTTVGDTVNIASRLENYDKEIGKDRVCRIIIGETTLRYLDGRFQTECLGEACLKGKDEKITIYRVLGRDNTGINRHAEEGKDA